MFFEENQYLYSPALPRSARTKMSKLLNAFELERSSVVANSLMNRERRLTGGNSYTRDLCLNPVDFISGRLATQHQITWLDICCGTGRALIDAGRLLVADRSSEKIAITGIDLVSMFDNVPNDLGFLRLKETAVLDWVPSESCFILSFPNLLLFSKTWALRFRLRRSRSWPFRTSHAVTGGPCCWPSRSRP